MATPQVFDFHISRRSENRSSSCSQLRFRSQLDTQKSHATLSCWSACRPETNLPSRNASHGERALFHCGKAFIRSKTWQPDSWPKDVKSNIRKQIAAKANADDTVADSIDNAMLEDYETGLY